MSSTPYYTKRETCIFTKIGLSICINLYNHKNASLKMLLQSVL